MISSTHLQVNKKEICIHIDYCLLVGVGTECYMIPKGNIGTLAVLLSEESDKLCATKQKLEYREKKNDTVVRM